ncbi:hypothetical protein, partial [Burkholderia gladioli]|uniref:hypothetical protein n=3 Tax=Burkholderia gladioli TaxID=28095 RepID=UPI003F7A3753
YRADMDRRAKSYWTLRTRVRRLRQMTDGSRVRRVHRPLRRCARNDRASRSARIGAASPAMRAFVSWRFGKARNRRDNRATRDRPIARSEEQW